MRDLEAFSWNGNIHKKLQISHKNQKVFCGEICVNNKNNLHCHIYFALKVQI